MSATTDDSLLPQAPQSLPDLAELSRLRDELASAQAQAEVRARIFRLLSHEFRTPLTVILSSTELLQTYGERWDPARRHRHLAKIAGSVGQLSSLLDDILLFNKVQEGVLEVSGNATAQPLRPFLVRLAQEPTEDEEAKRIRIDCPEELAFASDPELLAAALRNLLRNALDYTRGSVELRARLEANALVIAVEDEGPGLSEEERAHLFEPFFRGAASQGTPGTGLGLAVVQGCLALLGGRVACEPRHPSGTSFLVRIGGGA